MVIDLGAGAEFLLGGRTGPLLGLRAGYLATPITTDWQLYDYAISGGPSSTIAGPYIRATIGVARRR